MIIPTNHESYCSRSVCHDKCNGIFSPSVVPPYVLFIKERICSEKDRKRRKTDWQTGTQRHGQMQWKYNRYKSRGEKKKNYKKKQKTLRRGSLRSSLSHCKFPHLKNGEIHFSHRWEQARLISLKYPICWRGREGVREGGGEREGKKKKDKQGWTKQSSSPVLE